MAAGIPGPAAASVAPVMPFAPPALARRASPLAVVLGACLGAVPPCPALDAPSVAARMPEDTAAVVVLGDLSGVVGEARAFFRACGSPLDRDAFSARALAPVFVGVPGLEAEESGLSVDGPAVLFLDADLHTSGALVTLDDEEAFDGALEEAGGEPVEIEGIECHLIGAGEDSPPRVAAAAVSGCAVSAASAVALRAMLSPGGRAPLADVVTMPATGEVLFLVDLNRIIGERGEEIDRSLEMVRLLIAQSQRGAGVGAWGTLMALYTDMMRGAVRVAGGVETLAVRVRPRAEGLTVEFDIDFVPGAAALLALPRHIERELTLADALPPGALLTVGGTFDAERTARMMTAFFAWFTATLPAGASREAIFGGLTAQSLSFYSSLGDEFAYAMVPAAEGGLMPATVMLMRTEDPPLSAARLAALVASPAMLEMMRTMYAAQASGEIAFHDLGEREVHFAPVRHLRFSGLGRVMSDLMSEEEAAESVREVLSGLDAIDHWIAAADGFIAMTTEREPVLMAQILAGPGDPLAPPPLALGADYILRLRLSRLIAWASGVSDPPLPGGLLAAAEAMAVSEEGIWLTAGLRPRGLAASLFVPSGDVRAIVDAMSRAD